MSISSFFPFPSPFFPLPFAALPSWVDATKLPPKPSLVTAEPPFKRDNVTGTCVVPPPIDPVSAGQPGTWWTDSRVHGVHCWLANLLYSEQMAWPFDVWVSTPLNASTGVGYTVDPATGNRTYNFVIPLFSHVERDGSTLYSGSKYTQTASWSSYGAGYWVVFCNSFYMSPDTGEF